MWCSTRGVWDQAPGPAGLKLGVRHAAMIHLAHWVHAGVAGFTTCTQSSRPANLEEADIGRKSGKIGTGASMCKILGVVLGTENMWEGTWVGKISGTANSKDGWRYGHVLVLCQGAGCHLGGLGCP